MPTQPPGEPSIALFVILPGSRCCYGYASMILSTAKKVFFSFFACQISAASYNRDLRMLVAIFNAGVFFQIIQFPLLADQSLIKMYFSIVVTG